ncbi:MAG TPA: 50S ribosomal protein L6, partial [Aquifex aeolicus]|nr:50S ribosomal protein L6 [Aquifex aeolicus]
MSRLAKKPIPYPENVKVNYIEKEHKLVVEGPKG